MSSMSMSILKDAQDWAVSVEIHHGFHLNPDGRPVHCPCWPGGHCSNRSTMRPGEMLSPASALERLVKRFRQTTDELATSYASGWRGEKGREEFGRAVSFMKERLEFIEREVARRVPEIEAKEAREAAEAEARKEAMFAELRAKYPDRR